MSKKKRDRKKKRIQNETQRLTGKTKIDERIQVGPLELTRAGKLVVMQNNSTPEQHAETLKRAAKANKQILVELEAKIKELQTMVAKYDPLDLMNPAGYMAIGLLMHGKTESELTHDENKVLPGLEYLQYLIARTPPPAKPEDLSEETWKDIWARVFEVIELTSSYLMTRAPQGKNPSEVEGLVQSLDWMRLAVRVNRFPNFQVDYWRTSFEPYDNLLQQVYGVGAADVIKGLTQLSDFQRTGILRKHIEAHEAVAVLRARAEQLGLSEDDPEAYKASIQKSAELKALNEDAQNKVTEAYTNRLFEITDVSSLPKSILSLLTVKPGEEPLDKLTGPNHEDLSPLSTDVLHYKPFLEVDGKFYTFYHSGFEDRMAEIIEADLNQKQPAQRTSVEKARSDYIEKEATDLLGQILNPEYSGMNVYYPNPDENGQLTELDGLIQIDDILLLVEVKAGGISAGTSRGAPESLETDLKDLIFEGQRQSERAERYIRSSDKVDFYDHTGKRVVHSIEHKNFRRIFRVVVTREQLGWVGAGLAKLSVIDPSLDSSLPWQVSLDDLRAIADLFEGKSLEFSHYLEVRLEAAANKVLSQQDEIDHVSLYNAMNYYHKNVEASADRMTFNAYGLPIDQYFMGKAAGESPAKPIQKMPTELRALIDALNDSDQPHRFEVGSFLLGNDGGQRKDVTKHIKRIISKQKVDGQRTLRVASKDMKLGVSVGHVEDANWELEKARCAVYMKNNQLDKWLSVHIDTNDGIKVTQIVELKPEDFTDEQIAEAAVKLERDVQRNAARLNVARNQQCPCGSGERLKNCHGRKNGH
jgi:hypothetical protein